jgi:hypothetical protein
LEKASISITFKPKTQPKYIYFEHGAMCQNEIEMYFLVFRNVTVLFIYQKYALNLFF